MYNLIKIPFYEFLNEDLEINKFEYWLYNTQELKSFFSEDVYLELITFNYKSKDSKYFIRKFIKENMNWYDFEKWRTILLFKKIINNDIEIVLATRKLRDLFLEQEDEINSSIISEELAIGFESELEEYPLESEYYLYSKDYLNEKLKLISVYKNKIIEKVLIELNNLQISN